MWFEKSHKKKKKKKGNFAGWEDYRQGLSYQAGGMTWGESGEKSNLEDYSVCLVQ